MADTNIPAPPPGFSPVQTAPTSSIPAPPPGFSPIATPTDDRSVLRRAGDAALGAVDTATDIGEGIVAGGVGLVQGLAELPALALDLAFDTNASSAVTGFFDPINKFVAPEGAAGKVAADITTFGLGFVPFVGWLGRAGQVARGARAATNLSKGTGMTSAFMRSADNFGSSAAGRALLGTRAGMIGTTAAGAGAYGALVSADGRATLSDQFSVMPSILRTEEDTGMTGRDEALRRVRNRLRAGAEDAALSGAFDTALAGLGAGARQVAKVPQVAAAANAFSDTLSSTGGSIAARFPRATELAKQYLTPTGGADRLLYEESQDAIAQIDAGKKAAVTAATEYDTELQGVMKALNLKGPTQAKIVQAEVSDYLQGLRSDLPSITDPKMSKNVTEKLDRMISTSNIYVDRLMSVVEGAARNVEPGTHRASMAQEALDALKKTRDAEGMHLRRVFDMHKNPVRFYSQLDLSSPVAKKAQQEIAENLAKASGMNATDPQMVAQARDVVLRTLDLGSSATTKGLTDKQLVEMRLKAVREATEGKGRLGSLVAKERPEFVTDAGLLKKRQDIVTSSPALRELMGEVTDPMKRYLSTIEDVVRTDVASRFYDTLPRLGLESTLFDAIDALAAGKRPALVSVPDIKAMTYIEYVNQMTQFRNAASDINLEQGRQPVPLDTAPRQSIDKLTENDVIETYLERLRAAGYVQLGESAAKDVFGGIYGTASGKFVSPETYRAITQPLRLSQNIASEALAALSTFRNITQKMTIVPNVAAQVRNVLGNVGFLAGNANLPNGGDITDLFYTFIKGSEELDEAGLTRLARKLTLAGVADQNLVTRALKEYRAAAEDLTFNGKITAALDKAEGIIPFMRWFESAYSNTDTFFKGAALLAEESKIMSALEAAGGPSVMNNPYVLQSFIDNGLMARGASLMASGLDPVELMAAEIVKDTMPTYGRVVRAVKALDAVPIVGNFTSFAAETIRNSVGTANRAIKEMGYEAGPALRAQIGDAAADTLELQMRTIGVQRAMGYVTMATVLPKTMVKLSMAGTGTTPEEMAALYEMNPDYLRGHDLVILENNRDKGYIDFIDLSYVMPYAFMTDPVQAALREWAQNGRAAKNTVANFMDSVFTGFAMFADPFASETMFYERFRDVLPTNTLVGRGGKTATGAEIYGVNENTPDTALKIFNHLIAGFTPNYFTLAAEERSGQFQQGRLLRTVTGQPDRYGEQTTAGKEIARLVTGFTPMRLNMRQDAQFKGREYIPLRTDSRSRVNALIRRADVTADEVVSAWDTYLNELYSAQSALYRDIEAMRALNMTDIQIRYSLIRQAGLGRREANSIIDGRFAPGLPSREVADDIRAQLNREGRTRLLEDIPWGTLNDRTKERNNEPLRTAEEQRPSRTQQRQSPPPPPPPPGFFPIATPPVSAPPPPPPGFSPPPPRREGSVTPPPALPIGMPSAAPATRTAAVDPALLGGTLAEQAANAPIANSQA